MQAVEALKKEEEKKKKGFLPQEVEVTPSPPRPAGKMRLGDLRPKKLGHKIIPAEPTTSAPLRRSGRMIFEGIQYHPQSPKSWKASLSGTIRLISLNTRTWNLQNFWDLVCKPFVFLIALGTSGDVYRGVYRGDEVALKVLAKDRTSKLSDFVAEFKIMRYELTLNHSYHQCCSGTKCNLFLWSMPPSKNDFGARILFRWFSV